MVGSAGSGKTALTLEKLKHADVEVLYLTHSAYLAQNAHDLYYARGFEREDQEVTFLPENTASRIRPPARSRAGAGEGFGSP